VKKYILQNRKLITEKQALVSIHERGFMFGDGVFETCKIFNGKIYDFKSHHKRLEKGLNSLKIKAKIDDLETDSQKLITKNQVRNGLLRISISRGIGSNGYLPSPNCESLIIIETQESRIISGKISLGISPYQTPNHIIGKSMNALPYIRNKIAAQEENHFDLVMLSPTKFIAETSSANIFWVKNNKIYTADKTCSIIEGTVRNRLLKISPYKIYQVKKNISALKNADEIFLTNSSFLVLAVDEFLGRKLEKKWSKKMLEVINQDISKLCQN